MIAFDVGLVACMVGNPDLMEADYKPTCFSSLRCEAFSRLAELGPDMIL